MTKTMNGVRACTAILLAITLAAFATVLGRDFDDAYAQQIKPGATTKAEVVERLGRPKAAERTNGHVPQPFPRPDAVDCRSLDSGRTIGRLGQRPAGMANQIDRPLAVLA